MPASLGSSDLLAAFTFQYDADNRLTQKIENIYVAFDNRAGKRLDSDGDGDFDRDEAFVWTEGQTVLRAVDSDGEATSETFTLSSRYLYGEMVDQLLADEQYADGAGPEISTTTAAATSGETYWALTDHLGSVRDLVDNNGEIRQHVAYDSFGNRIVEQDYDASGTAISSSHPDAIDALFGYTGRDWDADAGLQNNRARWYDPATGRWLSKDPIGFAAGDANLYRYVGNQATTETDPSGLANFILPSAIPGSGITPQQDLENQRVDSYAAVNGVSRAAGSLFSLGFKTDYDIVTPPIEVREARQYDLAVSGYQCVTEFGTGFGIGKAATAPGRVGKALFVFDTTQNLSMTGQGVYNGNPLQAGLGTLGLSGNAAGVMSAERVLITRGVSGSNHGSRLARQGIAKPNRPWWQYLREDTATPLDHNAKSGATLRSIFTSWTTDCRVSRNFASGRLGQESGTVITAAVHPWRIVPSPDTKNMLIWGTHPGVWVRESEVLVIGTVKGTPAPTKPLVK
ncbi:RHS repeat-associated core domain-containing protein [Novipirellula caenicola]|uniref:Teneurin-like YD-shell domain-containing protein n=1 Tax=Novipirellula caenicola TaxID=1536901 RepID=A0ABP9W307_9BACT